MYFNKNKFQDDYIQESSDVSVCANSELNSEGKFLNSFPHSLKNC